MSGLAQYLIRLGEGEAEMTGDGGAEPVAGQDRDRLALEQALCELFGAEASLAHIEQHEHTAFGRRRMAIRRSRQDLSEERGATAIILMQRLHLGQLGAERD